MGHHAVWNHRLVLSCALIFVFSLPAVAIAGVHFVTNNADAGPGSYRQAILDASGDATPVTIEFNPGLTIQLSSGDVTYTGNQPITLNGSNSTIDGGSSYHILLATNAAVIVNQLRVRNGYSNVGTGGITSGGISGSLEVNQSIFTNNQGIWGGALYAGSEAEFGGSDTLISNSIFVDNRAEQSGGVLYTNAGATITNSSFIRNQATQHRGGAVYVTDDLQVTASHFRFNQASNAGGAINQASGQRLTQIWDSTFVGNQGSTGGGINTVSTLQVFDSIFEDNVVQSEGGALNGSETEIRRSLFRNNRVLNGRGGAVSATTGEIHRSTFSGNWAGESGGALVFSGESMVVVNSTFTGNLAGTRGGAIFTNSGVAELTLTHVTLVGNTGSQGAHLHLDNSDGSLTIFASVLADPIDNEACWIQSPVISQGFNYNTDDSCGLGAGAGDVSNGDDPHLLELDNYGGPTPTRRPSQGSALNVAIPVGNCSGSVTIDQRGVARPQGAGCSIGAVEVAGGAGLFASVHPQKLRGGGGALSRIRGTLVDTSGQPLANETVNFEVIDGDGQLSSTSVLTNTLGRAEANYQTSAADDDSTVVVQLTSGALVASVSIDVASAMTLEVTSAADSGPDSLRAALDQADSAEETVVIRIAEDLSIELTSGQLEYHNHQPLVLYGEAADAPAPDSTPATSSARGAVSKPVLDGGGNQRILHAPNALEISVENLRLQNGLAPDGEGGGALAVGGNVKSIDVDFVDNQSGIGGAVASDFGGVDSLRSTFTGNQAVDPDGDPNGGAIWSRTGTIILRDSVFENNSGYVGGAVATEQGGVQAYSSHFAGNSAEVQGGAIWLTGGILLIADSLFDNNSVTNGRGGAVSSNSPAVHIADSVFSGNSSGDSDGGATWFQAESLVLIERSEFSNNQTVGCCSAGAIRFSGSNAEMRIIESRFLNNIAAHDGGAIYVDFATALVIIDSEFEGNSALDDLGGAIVGGLVPTVIEGSTFTGNSATGQGGAIRASSNLEVRNSTFDGNSVTETGGAGGALWTSQNTEVAHVTFTDNTADQGGQIYTGGSLSTFAVVVAGAGTCQMTGSFDSQGYNYETGDSCGFGGGTGDVSNGADPLLAPLADNGGPTRTRLPDNASPLIDAIPPGDCPHDADQRGVARPQGDGCDIGAVEVLVLLIHTVTPSSGIGGSVDPELPQSVEHGDTASFTVLADVGYARSDTVGGDCPAGSWSGDVWTTGPIVGDCSVSFSFNLITYMVTPSAGAGGSIDPDTPQTVEHGATTAFTVTPDAGHTANVGGTCGGGLDGTTFTTDPVTADCTVEATFTLIDPVDQIFTDRFESVELQMPQF